MAAPVPSPRLVDGTLDASGGVDSARVTTVASPSNPNGLPRTMLSWLVNATVRGGGISPRNAWLGKLAQVGGANQTQLFQGGMLYEPLFGNPYLIISLGGHIYKILVEAPFTITDLSAEFNLFNPPLVDQAFFCQGEQFLVIQAGDFLTNATPTLPLFWDGTTLTRSRGIISANNVPPSPPGTKPFNQLPAATCMVYYQGRIWYAQKRVFCAGDIVGNSSSGTAFYDFTDSVLYVTENPLAAGGDGFSVPSQAGDIRALDYSANLDATLGQGPLYVFTRKQIYQVIVPTTRTDWIAATSNNQPQITVVQKRFGAVSDRSVVAVNGDLFYQSLEPAIRSLFVSIRYFSQWGNVPLSRNENRIFNSPLQDRSLMRFSSGILFDNRLLQAVLPIQTPCGVAFQGLVPLDFDIISQFGQEAVQTTKAPPAWEGIWEGLQILQVFEDDFGGLQRAFAVIRLKSDGSLQVWELSNALLTDNGDNRITWVVETPAFTFQREFDLKTLDGGEIWLDQVYGTVIIQVEWRVDADPCWNLWKTQEICVARNSCEDVKDPVCYPIQEYCEGFKFPIELPTTDGNNCVSLNKRPVNVGYQFQFRITITGQARIRGYQIYAIPVKRRPGEGLEC